MICNLSYVDVLSAAASWEQLSSFPRSSGFVFSADLLWPLFGCQRAECGLKRSFDTDRLDDGGALWAQQTAPPPPWLSEAKQAMQATCVCVYSPQPESLHSLPLTSSVLVMGIFFFFRKRKCVKAQVARPTVRLSWYDYSYRPDSSNHADCIVVWLLQKMYFLYNQV